jgi:hypothetical protein|tara:strand:+ start:173 stop:427 length:255 start_codon:yes stop_codon:yes gene_type:complete
MYKAIVSETEGTGAGYGNKPHVYIMGEGVAFSKSPKKAMAHAKRLCVQALLVDNIERGLGGVGQIPVYGAIELYKDGKLIYCKY